MGFVEGLEQGHGPGESCSSGLSPIQDINCESWRVVLSRYSRILFIVSTLSEPI